MNQEKDQDQTPGNLINPNGEVKKIETSKSPSPERVSQNKTKNNKEWFKDVLLSLLLVITIFFSSILFSALPQIYYIAVGPPEGFGEKLLVIGLIIGFILSVVIGGKISKQKKLKDSRTTITLSILTFLSGATVMTAAAFRIAEPDAVQQSSLAAFLVISFLIVTWFGFHYLARKGKFNLMVFISLFLIAIGIPLSILKFTYVSEQRHLITQHSVAIEGLNKTLETDYQLYFPSDVTKLKLNSDAIIGTSKLKKYSYELDGKKGKLFISQIKNKEPITKEFCASCRKTLTTEKGIEVYRSHNSFPNSIVFTIGGTHIKLNPIDSSNTPNEFKDEKWINDFVDSFKSYSDEELRQLFIK